MEHRIVLVTGATRGIGLETVRQLAELGHTVHLGARQLSAGEARAAELRRSGGDVLAIEIDLERPETFHAAAEQIRAEHGRLDSLVNNAGICLESFGSPVVSLSQEVLVKTFQVNLFAQIEATHAFLGLLRESRAGRIVFLSSILGSIATHADPASGMAKFQAPAYDLSKTALNAYAVHLANELRGHGIKVNAAHPGWVRTEMGGPNAPLDVREGARTSVELATLPDEGPTGGFFHLGKPLPW
jgi:NAD(P)-dependent dehydrogenase (short-subunit alcohol dehydrogenase family)